MDKTKRYIEIVTCEKPFRKHVFQAWWIHDDGSIHVCDTNPGIEQLVFKNYLYYTIYTKLGVWQEN